MSNTIIATIAAGLRIESCSKYDRTATRQLAQYFLSILTGTTIVIAWAEGASTVLVSATIVAAVQIVIAVLDCKTIRHHQHHFAGTCR